MKAFARLCCFTLLVPAAAAAQRPWRPALGVSVGRVGLKWARMTDAGNVTSAELAFPVGPYLGLRGLVSSGNPPSADTSMRSQHLSTTELFARLRLASWRSARVYGEVGTAIVRLRARSLWANEMGELQDRSIKRQGGLRSVGVAVGAPAGAHLWLETRATRVNGHITQMWVDGEPYPYFETSSLTIERLEFSVSWQP